MKCEYTISKNKHYFKGPKFQLSYIQIFLFIFLTSLGFTINWIFFLLIFLVCFCLNRIIYNQLKNISYNVTFSDNCIYSLTENYDQINKLFGVSETFHHWNSARIGWRCVDGENIELLAYCYVNKKRVYKKLINCKPNNLINCNIQTNRDNYVLSAKTNDGDKNICYIPRVKFKLYSIFMYKLYPYFGGIISSPHDMNIKLEKTNEKNYK